MGNIFFDDFGIPPFPFSSPLFGSVRTGHSGVRTEPVRMGRYEKRLDFGSNRLRASAQAERGRIKATFITSHVELIIGEVAEQGRGRLAATRFSR